MGNVNILVERIYMISRNTNKVRSSIYTTLKHIGYPVWICKKYRKFRPNTLRQFIGIHSPKEYK